jgi:hypothetical protein
MDARLFLMIALLGLVASAVVHAQCYVVRQVPPCNHPNGTFPCCGNPWPNPPPGSCYSKPETGPNTTDQVDDADPSEAGQTGYNRTGLPGGCAFYAVINCTPPCGYAEVLSTMGVYLDQLTGNECTGQ